MENEFTVGQVLSKSFDAFGQNFPFMLIIAVLAVLPGFFIQLFPNSLVMVWLGLLGNLLMYLALQGVVVYGVFQHLTGRKAVFGESLAVALGRLGNLLIVSVVVFLLTAVGYLMLVIPGLIIQLMFWVAVPVVVVERGDLSQALRRSKDLTVGYRGRIFAVLFILGVIGLVLGLIQGVILAMLLDTTSGSGTLGHALTVLPVNVVFQGLVTALGSVVVTVGYYTLRHEVEGVATEDLASVFE
jgi:hypothetical protein